MRKERDGRGKSRPLSLMGKPHAPKMRGRIEEAEGTRLALNEALPVTKASEPENESLSVREARNRARRRIYRSAEELVSGLIENGSGNYLAVKFLFEFAGLAGEGLNEDEEDSPLLKAYLETLQKDVPPEEPEQTLGAKLNLSSEERSQIS
ncbi:MAG TPA: hypothetical protein VFM10_01130 [Terriglobales bacterium]|jgi:hypothetical protein|nr:hypothetical protein [Terriglobales bacterium]